MKALSPSQQSHCDTFKRAVAEVVNAQAKQLLDVVKKTDNDILSVLDEFPYSLKEEMQLTSIFKWLKGELEAGNTPSMADMRNQYSRVFMQWFLDIVAGNKSFNGANMDPEAMKDFFTRLNANKPPGTEDRPPRPPKREKKPRRPPPPPVEEIEIGEDDTPVKASAHASASGDRVHVTAETHTSGGSCNMEQSGTGEANAHCGGNTAPQKAEEKPEFHFDDL